VREISIQLETIHVKPKASKISTFGKRISSMFASKRPAKTAAVKSRALEEKSSASVQKLVQLLPFMEFQSANMHLPRAPHRVIGSFG